jgi:hypothetical protein
MVRDARLSLAIRGVDEDEIVTIGNRDRVSIGSTRFVIPLSAPL